MHKCSYALCGLHLHAVTCALASRWKVHLVVPEILSSRWPKEEVLKRLKRSLLHSSKAAATFENF